MTMPLTPPALWPGSVLVARRELGGIARNKTVLFQLAFFGIAFPALQGLWATPGTAGFQNLNLGLVAFVPYAGALPAVLQAFAGERAERTLGPLLATPLQNGSIFLGKLTAAYLPALAASTLALGVFALVLQLSPPEPAAPVVPPDLPGVSPDQVAQVAAEYRRLHGLVPELGAAGLGRALLFGAVAGTALVVVGLIASTRAETLKAAQTLAGLLNIPLLIGTLYAGSKVLDSTVAVLVTALLALPLLAAALVVVARQWRREEAVLGRAGRARCR